jgi:hypothetical protein
MSGPAKGRAAISAFVFGLKVGGRQFSYSAIETGSPAFHGSETYGGPIHRDSKVRIGFVRDKIMRLEVQDHVCPPAPELAK